MEGLCVGKFLGRSRGSGILISFLCCLLGFIVFERGYVGWVGVVVAIGFGVCFSFFSGVVVGKIKKREGSSLLRVFFFRCRGGWLVFRV